MLARDLAPSRAVGPTRVLRSTGTCVHRQDRRINLDQSDWSDLADNAEGSDGRDDFRYAPLAIPQRPLELPSLVPSTLQFLLPDPDGWAGLFHHSTPLRC